MSLLAIELHSSAKSGGSFSLMTLIISLNISASVLLSTKQSSVLFSCLGKMKRLAKYVALLLQLFKVTLLSMEAGDTSFFERLMIHFHFFYKKLEIWLVLGLDT